MIDPLDTLDATDQLIAPYLEQIQSLQKRLQESQQELQKQKSIVFSYQIEKRKKIAMDQKYQEEVERLSHHLNQTVIQAERRINQLLKSEKQLKFQVKGLQKDLRIKDQLIEDLNILTKQLKLQLETIKQQRLKHQGEFLRLTDNFMKANDQRAKNQKFFKQQIAMLEESLLTIQKHINPQEKSSSAKNILFSDFGLEISTINPEKKETQKPKPKYTLNRSIQNLNWQQAQNIKPKTSAEIDQGQKVKPIKAKRKQSFIKLSKEEKNRALKEINLGNHRISKSSLTNRINNDEKLQNLQVIDIKYLNIKRNIKQFFRRRLEGEETFYEEKIDFSLRIMSDKFVQLLINNASKFKCLKEIQLGGKNQITYEGFKLLIENLSKFPYLRKIGLNGKQIGYQGLIKIMSTIPRGILLNQLNLNRNQISDHGLKLLMNEIYKMPLLNKIALGFNQITDSGLTTLLEYTEKMFWLREIDLRGFQTLMKRAHQLPNLKRIGISKNSQIMNLPKVIRENRNRFEFY